jgi:hypothetical protein
MPDRAEGWFFFGFVVGVAVGALAVVMIGIYALVP